MDQVFTTTVASALAVGLYWTGSIDEALGLAQAMGQWLDMWLPA
jgi:hypothetical protein